MDCPSEEQLIRMRLDGFHEVQELTFDIPNRSLTVYHTGNVDEINKALQSLNLNATLTGTENAESITVSSNHKDERKLLWIVLFINFSLFLVELVTGFVSNSMGLVADSLDMLADAIIYGLSLYAVGRLVATKMRVAKASGYFQLALAMFGLVEIIRRFFSFEEVPVFQTMILISVLALIGNAASLYLLKKSKSNEVHMQASMIFTSNDVLANIGVIVAGVLVHFTNSKVPDLVIGSVVFVLVVKGALRILKLGST